MSLPSNKTKIICTIGPVSESPEAIEKLILAGMDVARLNFSHGDLKTHEERIGRIRDVAGKTGKRVAIMVDLPGPKIRIGEFAEEPVDLRSGESFLLTTEDIVGDVGRASVNFPNLPGVVKPGDTLFLNDGLIQLEVVRVEGKTVACRVVAGGELRSRKGLNLPGISLGIDAFTEHDRDCMAFALEKGVDAISQSFVESAGDVERVREASRSFGKNPFIIAKIERSVALDQIDEILHAADGIMIARGDLGVDIPIEQIAIAQKRIMDKALFMGKPVITATQMLESMVDNPRPTRAEATDVANAILDGTDCVMLSGESAVGKYPVEAVSMLASIAKETEPHRSSFRHEAIRVQEGVAASAGPVDIIASSIQRAFEYVSPAAVIVPTLSGYTARSLARFRFPVWVTAVSPHHETCQALTFSYGVYPVCEPDYPEDWNTYAREWVRREKLDGRYVILTEGPSPRYPEGNNRMEIIDLERQGG